jgi:hypothetical protein
MTIVLRRADGATGANDAFVDTEQAAIADGRCALFFVFSFPDTTLTLTGAAAGMTSLGHYNFSTSFSVQIFIKELDGTEDNTFSVTGPSWADCGVLILNGVDVAATIASGNSSASTGTSTTATGPARTGVNGGWLVSATMVSSGGSVTIGTPSGMTRMFGVNADEAAVFIEPLSSGGSTGTRSSTLSGSIDWVSATAVLQPKAMQSVTAQYFRITQTSNVPPAGNTFSAAEINLLDGTGTPISRGSWSVSASTEHSGNEASKAIDNNVGTFWESEWSPLAPLPQYFTINMGSSQAVSALRYTPRDGSAGSNGRITYFDIQKSSDGTTWGAPVGGSNYDQFTDVDGNATRDFPIQEPAATGITYVAYEEHLFID